MPLVPVNAANTVTHGAVLMELSAGVHSINNLLYKACVVAVWTAPGTLSGADLALQDTGALSAAEYGRLAVWAHFLPFSGLSVASNAAGWCISAVLLLCGVRLCCVRIWLC